MYDVWDIRFWSFWANYNYILYGASGDYYLSIVHEKFEVTRLRSDFDYLGPFWRENGRRRHAAPNGLGPKSPTKKFTRSVDLLFKLLSCRQNSKILQ